MMRPTNEKAQKKFNIWHWSKKELDGISYWLVNLVKNGEPSKKLTLKRPKPLRRSIITESAGPAISSMPSGEKYDSCGTFGMKLAMARTKMPNTQDSMSRQSEKPNGCTSFEKNVPHMPRESFFIHQWKSLWQWRMICKNFKGGFNSNKKPSWL
jgi:hypothetical protein